MIDLYKENGRRLSIWENTAEQTTFELDFPYELTPDQAKSIDEIKDDMQKSRPMDRLLCGDVGYGKTEVAVSSIQSCNGRKAGCIFSSYNYFSSATL